MMPYDTFEEAWEDVGNKFQSKLQRILPNNKLSFEACEMGYRTEAYIYTDCKSPFSASIASISLSTLIHCCGVAVISDASVRYAHRRKGVGNLLLEMAEEAARMTGHSYMLCTDIKDNLTRHMLISRGWVVQDTFYNVRSGNYVSVYGKFVENPIGEYGPEDVDYA